MVISKKEIVIPEEIRQDVYRTLPAVMLIKNVELREMVVNAWAWALSENGYKSIDELPGSGNPDGPVMGTQSMHINGVGRLALALAVEMETITGKSLNIDKDLLVAAGLCHDVGKPFEFNPVSRERWKADSKVCGLPALRHPAYGAYVALTLGMPEVIVHTAGCHSPEGRFVVRSLITTIVNRADEDYWRIIERANDVVVELM
ncbi:MAG: HD domain-containing protein [Ruminiclostridium sp.]|nr:HD domain-containing protein [Ruminiclostridium sp.]